MPELISLPVSEKDPEKVLLLLLKALDTIEDGIHIVDATGRTILYSKGCQRIENLKKREVLGKHISEAYQLNDETSILLKVLKTGLPITGHHTTYMTSKGTTVNIITDTYPIFSKGKIIAAVSINRDVTKIKELADKISRLQNQLYSYSRKSANANGTIYTLEDIIGQSEKIKNVIQAAKKFAASLSPILIQGETGTGKELFAQGIHNASSRAQGPFVAINCAAIPETLLEGILFGTTKGAFTGAIDKPGLFEEAGEGTLFLDEINSMGLGLQAKLLRALQTNTIRRVGGSKDIYVRPRIISTINVDPLEAITKNQLRADLFYRVAVGILVIPPLRERKEDIPELIKHFIQIKNKLMGKRIQGVSQDVFELFMKYDWPGNVRELEHSIEHAMNMADATDTLILKEHLPPYLLNKYYDINTTSLTHKILSTQNLKATLMEVEKEIILTALKEKGGNITHAANRLGVSRQYLQYRIRRLNISRNLSLKP